MITRGYGCLLGVAAGKLLISCLSHFDAFRSMSLWQLTGVAVSLWQRSIPALSVEYDHV